MIKENNKSNKIELLAPAGNLSKLKYAFAYGADAVYCGVPDFSLRTRINQFSQNDLSEAVKYAHGLKKKIYITLNIYAHNSHLENIEKHLRFLKKIKPDGIIVSDPGIINLIQKHLPEVDIHLSTQANATNSEAVKFWRDLGVKRIILAREVTLEEIKEISQRVKGIELECFVHGAMCMSYSGRCILSKWMTNRSANLGDCSQPCRWKYNVVDDQKRFEMDLEEDQHGTYFFNSYDMNLLAHVDALISAGVTSLKIEGRAKSAYYLAIATRAYRKVLDAVNQDDKAKLKKIIAEQQKELDKLTHRGYSTGFLLGSEPEHNFEGKLNATEYKFVGEVEGLKDNLCVVRVHNEIFLEDEIEIVSPEGNFLVKIKRMLDSSSMEVNGAHGGHQKRYYFEFNKQVLPGSLIRKKGDLIV